MLLSLLPALSWSQAQVAETLATFPERPGIVLAMLGPKNWRKLSPTDAQGVTRLAFVEWPSQKVILDLGKRLPTGFSGYVMPAYDIIKSPSAKNVAILVQERSVASIAVYAVLDKTVNELALPLPSLGKTLAANFSSVSWLEDDAFLRWGMNAFWESDTKLKVACLGRFVGSAQHPKQWDFVLTFGFDLLDGKVTLTSCSGEVDNVSKPKLTPQYE